MEHYIAHLEALSGQIYSYTILSVLPVHRQDAFKASYQAEDGSLRYCFIRQGQPDVLQRQYHVLLEAAAVMVVPAVLDFFEKDGVAYLVTEWIEGDTLDKVVHRIFRQRRWENISRGSRAKVIGYLIAMTKLLQQLHDLGYAHGRVRADKFMLQEDTIYLVSFAADADMQAIPVPMPEKDVYFLGWILILFLTDYRAHKFDLARPERLSHSLLYCIGDVEVVKWIVACMDSDPAKRPAPDQLLTALFRFEARIAARQSKAETSFAVGAVNRANIEKMVRQSLLIPIQEDGPFAPVNTGNWMEGMAGLYYVAGRCPLPEMTFRQVGTPVSVAISTSGLYEGLAGVAAGMAATGNGSLEGWFEKTPVSAGIAAGAAGQGLAALHTIQVAGREKAQQMAMPYVQYLLEKQLPDGSWGLPAEILTVGFSDGIAGIATFLWIYHSWFADERIRQSAVAAMDWLQQHTLIKDRGLYGVDGEDMVSLSPWFSTGVAGIAFCFITAYRVSNDPVYRQMAENILYTLSDHFHSAHFNFLEGIAGLGETYLEAWQVLHDRVWQQRAHQIASELMHVNKQNRNGGCYWITGPHPKPLAGLLTGNAGILHFLMRYASDTTAVPHLFLPY